VLWVLFFLLIFYSLQRRRQQQETNKLTSVCTLKLDGNDIEAEGARRLAECLKTNDTITFVDLKWNLISVEGTRYLAQALEHNTTLVRISHARPALGTSPRSSRSSSFVLFSRSFVLYVLGVTQPRRKRTR